MSETLPNDGGGAESCRPDAGAVGGPTPRPTAERRSYTVSAKAKAQRRAAAQKSTGPTSVNGKATSSCNAVTHGMTAFETPILVGGEDATAYQELREALRRQYPPLDAIGEFAVSELANALWRSRRINLAEAALIDEERGRHLFAEALAHEFPGRVFPNEPGRKPYGYLLRTAAGVAKLLAIVGGTRETIPSIEQMDAEAWRDFRQVAKDLASAVPEFEKFINAPPTEQSLNDWAETADQVLPRLIAQHERLQCAEQALRARNDNRSFVPDGAPMRLVVRYTAMNDRKIEKLLKLIEKHCGKPSDVEDA